jgi:molybdopterin molybdotransferase
LGGLLIQTSVGAAAGFKHGQVRNSNSIALVAEVGGEPHDQCTARDEPAVLASLLEAARRDVDLLIMTGGASTGERDLVRGVLKELGAEFLFAQVAMRPGKPFSFALWCGLPVCVLPGNPAAAYVCFQELVRPALARLAGKNTNSTAGSTCSLTGGAARSPGT